MKGKTVLLVDDEEDLTWSISRSLKRDKTGLHILCANSGESALELLESSSVDLLVTDLRMSGIDGFDLIDHVQKRHLPVKIIVMTAYGSQEVMSQLLDKGCLFYIEKPFEMANLKQKIYAALSEPVPPLGGKGGLQDQISQVLKLSRYTPEMLLTVYREGREGKLYSSYGRIYDARLGKKRGSAALKEIFGWNYGVVKAQIGQVPLH